MASLSVAGYHCRGEGHRAHGGCRKWSHGLFPEADCAIDKQCSIGGIKTCALPEHPCGENFTGYYCERLGEEERCRAADEGPFPSKFGSKPICYKDHQCRIG